MIFGRKKKVEPAPVEDVADEVALTGEASDEDPAGAPDAADPGAETDEAAQSDEWVAYDRSRDWRDDGPFDIDEVDLSDDEVERVDLGALIITPETGMNIKLVTNAQTKQIMHLVVENAPQSALQVTVFAAPADVDYAAQIRQDLIDHTEKAKTIEMAKGPFGTELRRVLTVTDDQGREGFAPLRDWVISGPRWVLNCRLIGQAALDTKAEGPAAQLEEFVRNTIVRRGDTAMAPGTVVTLTPAKQ